MIDFFPITKDTKIYEHGGIRYEDPISIIYNKMKIYESSSRIKDIADFIHINERMI